MKRGISKEDDAIIDYVESQSIKKGDFLYEIDGRDYKIDMSYSCESGDYLNIAEADIDYESESDSDNDLESVESFDSFDDSESLERSEGTHLLEWPAFLKRFDEQLNGVHICYWGRIPINSPPPFSLKRKYVVVADKGYSPMSVGNLLGVWTNTSNSIVTFECVIEIEQQGKEHENKLMLTPDSGCYIMDLSEPIVVKRDSSDGIKLQLESYGMKAYSDGKGGCHYSPIIKRHYLSSTGRGYDNIYVLTGFRIKDEVKKVWKSVRKIQEQWRESISNPKYEMCRKRLMRSGVA